MLCFGAGAEDGALWQDRESGTFHFLVHMFPNGRNTGSNRSVPSAVGGHAFSADGWSWTYSKRPAYTTALRLSEAEGGRTVLYRRERPKPFFDRNTGGLSGLWNGAWPCHVGNDDEDTQDLAAGCESYTLMTPII